MSKRNWAKTQNFVLGNSLFEMSSFANASFNIELVCPSLNIVKGTLTNIDRYQIPQLCNE